MAQKRMFDKAITNSDNFLELTDACQNLYFHLSMNADDDGFVDNWKSILRMTNHKPADMQELVKTSFIIPFESGVIVIRHWRMNNYLRQDRYKETTHKVEKSLLKLGKNEEYLLDSECIGIPMVDTDKNSIDKNSIDKNNILCANQKKYEKEFEELWKLYPNKKGKDKAQEKYIKARQQGTTYEEVLSGLNNYNEYIKKTKTSLQYVKNGSSWFNQKCWKDEYKVEEIPIKKTREQEFQEQLERMRKLDEEEEKLKNE